MFDDSKIEEGIGAGVVFVVPSGQVHQFSHQLDEQFIRSKNQAEYEALIIGLELAIELRITSLQVFRDSQLVIKQTKMEYRCCNKALEQYMVEFKWLISFFNHVSFQHMFQIVNRLANEMAQVTSGVRSPKGSQERIIRT